MKGLRLKRKLRNYLRWQIYIINLVIYYDPFLGGMLNIWPLINLHLNISYTFNRSYGNCVSWKGRQWQGNFLKLDL